MNDILLTFAIVIIKSIIINVMKTQISISDISSNEKSFMTGEAERGSDLNMRKRNGFAYYMCEMRNDGKMIIIVIYISI